MPQCQTFSDQEIESLRKGGKILRGCLDYVESLIKPGVKTMELDQAAEDYIRSNGGVPGFKGYSGYPATLCTSVNEQCVHGIPGDRELKDGDIIAVDCGVIYEGFNTDACFTAGVGTITDEKQKLMDASQNALLAAVAMVKAGIRVGDISSTVQKSVEGDGFYVVRALTGHGLGTTLHQFPDIPNFGRAGTGPVLPANTLIAIEPIVAAGCGEIRDARDGWTIETKDGSLSTHFEHTILVREGDCEIIA